MDSIMVAKLSVKGFVNGLKACEVLIVWKAIAAGTIG